MHDAELCTNGAQRPDEVTSYLEAKGRVFSQSKRASEPRGSAQHVIPISNLLKEKTTVREGGVRGRNAAEKSQVAEALRTTVAYFLVSVGHTPDSVRAAERGGIDLLASATRIVLTEPSIIDGLSVSPVVVEAEVVSARDDADKRNRILTFRQRQRLAGTAAETFELTVPTSDGLYTAQQGQMYLLFLSPEIGAFKRAAGRPSGGTLDQVFPSYLIDGETYRSTTPYTADKNVPAAEVQQFIAAKSSYLTTTRT